MSSRNSAGRSGDRTSPRHALKLTVAYDGRAFFGSQRQAGKRTVQGALEVSVAELFGQPAPVYLAGRTDQGVHAAGQVASCADYRPDLRTDTILRAVNAKLSDDLAVLRVERKRLGFHARYDAVWREYRYRIWTGGKHPLVAPFALVRDGALDVAAMDAAAARLIGTHDFASFAGGGEGVPWSERQAVKRGTERTVRVCEVRSVEPWWGPPADVGGLVEARIAADGFLPRMVRGIVGALIEIGQGSRPVAWIDDLIEARDRRAGAKSAPAHGLTLWRVGYDDDDPRND